MRCQRSRACFCVVTSEIPTIPQDTTLDEFAKSGESSISWPYQNQKTITLGLRENIRPVATTLLLGNPCLRLLLATATFLTFDPCHRLLYTSA